MSGINKVILVGHLGKAPELRFLTGGIAVARFPFVTSEMISKDSRQIEVTEWHNIVLWRTLAESAAKLLTKGSLVYLEGKLRTRSFTDQSNVKKYTTEIVVDFFTLLTTI
jgi:single-strand DNA-binding protein